MPVLRFRPVLPLAWLALLALACGISLPAGLFAAPTPTPLPQPPALLETDPPAGSLIGPQQSVTVLFNQAMEKNSTQAALTEANQDVVLTWVDETSVSITPKTPLQPFDVRQVILPSGLTGLNGLRSAREQEVSFRVAGPLRVEQILPAPDAQGVSTSAQIVAAFNQPVTPLGADPQTLPAAFALQPAAPGHGEWLNSSTYLFTPEPALPGGQTFSVTLNPGLISTLGTALENPRSWQFVTALPQVLEIQPNAEQGMQSPQPSLRLRFNQPMDKASLESAVSLICDAQAQPLQAWQWNDRATEVTLEPAQKLPRGSLCSLQAAVSARSQSGLALSEAALSAFQVYPLLGIQQLPASPKPFYQPFQLKLSAPLAEQDNLQDFLSVSPAVTNFSAVSYGTRIDFYGDFAANQEYIFTIAPGLRDIFGETLPDTLRFSGSTQPREPTLELPYTDFLFVRPNQAVASARLTSLHRLQFSRSPLSLNDFFPLNASYDAVKAYTFPNGEFWESEVPYAEQMQSYDLPLRPDGGALEPGLYFLGVLAPEGVNPYSADRRLFVIASNINLTFKISAKNALVWAVDVRTGQPVSGATVNIYDEAGKRLGGGSTSAEGLWRGELSSFDLRRSAWAVLNAPGDDAFGMAGSTFNPGLSPWELGLTVNYAGEQPFVYLYSDRPVYRPGDTIHVHGMALQSFFARYAALPDAAQGWEIALQYAYQDAQNPQALTLSPYGGFDVTFDLPETAPTGYWQVTVRAPQAGEKDPLTFNLPLQVADYRKPELDPQVSFSPTEIVSGQAVTAQVQVNYFFGAPASEAPVTWTLYRQPQPFELPGYLTGPYFIPWQRSSSLFGETVHSGSGLTDGQGTLTLNFDDLQADSFSLYRLEVTVTETGGYPVSATGTLNLHPGLVYAGIAPRSFTAQAGQALTFDLLAADWQQSPQPGQALALTWEKVTWKNQPTPYGEYTYQLLPQTLEQKSVTSDPQGAASATFTPAAPGTYRLRVAAGASISEALVWVSGSGSFSWPVLPFDQISLSADKKSYQAGQTPSLFIPNPFEQPAQALLTMERGDLLDSRLVTVAPGGQTLSLPPLTDANAPNTYVSAVLLGSGTQFRLGYLNLPVTPGAFTLSATLQASPQTAHPGDKVTLDLQVTDAQGQPAQGEFSLAVVDIAALALAAPNAPDILPAFYDSQPLGVRTGLSDAMDPRRLLPNPGGLGGGGGADVPPLRENFPDTALWVTFQTDAAGQAQVSFTLPDSLTTWQVDTRGLDRQLRVGQARLQIVTRKELLLRPITPRFLLVGDHLRLGTAVNNTTEKAFSAQVSLQAEGVSLDPGQAAEQTVQIPAGGRALVWWWVRVEDVSSVRLAFRALGGGWSDATLPAEGELPVLRFSAPQTFSTGATLGPSAAQSEIISLPRRYTPLGGNLHLELTPSLGLYLRQSAQGLTPPDEYASNEELASYLLSTLALAQSGMDYALPPQAVQAAQRILQHQNSDGGWGWYWNASGASDSEAQWTAYALWALLEARAQNALPAGDWSYSLQNAADFLGARLQNAPAPQSMSADSLEAAALSVWALIQVSGTPSPLVTDTLQGLSARAEALNPAGLAFTLLAARQAGLETFSLVNLLEQEAQRSATGASWVSQSSQRVLPASTTFQTAAAMNSLEPKSPLMEQALRFLVFSRQPGGQWAFGMENALAYRALAAFLKQSGDTGATSSLSAALNGRSLVNTQSSAPLVLDLPLSALYAQSPNELRIQRGEGGGLLFYRADLQVMRPAQSAPPLNAGIAVSRAYFDCSADPCLPIEAWKLSSNPGRVTVRVTVTVPVEMRYLAVEDYAPSGAEIANPALKTTQQGDPSLTVEKVDPENPFAQGWGWWLFQPAQIYRDHLRWTAEQLPAGTYVLTYTLVPSLAGEFQVAPARAWQVYFPEVQGSSTGIVFKIAE